MRVAPLVVRSGDRQVLLSWVRSTSIRAGLAQRARIVLLAADGVSNTDIATRVGVSRPMVTLWRTRYEQAGMDGLVDEPRSGRPRTVDREAIIAATLRTPPKSLGVTHWSSRLLASRLKTSNSTVAKAWREVGVQPWRLQTFKFSTDPELVAKVTDIVGLYLAPPENAVVLCVDEKSQIQAPGPHRGDAADATGVAGAAHRRLHPQRHHHPVRRPEHRHRPGHRALPAAAPQPGVPAVPAPGRPRLPRR